MIYSKQIVKLVSKESNIIPVTSRVGPKNCGMSRIPHFVGKQLTDGGDTVSLTLQPRFDPQKDFFTLISVRGEVNPRAEVLLEGLG